MLDISMVICHLLRNGYWHHCGERQIICLSLLSFYSLVVFENNRTPCTWCAQNKYLILNTALVSQCSKLRVHSAPGAHISAAGRTFFRRVCPMYSHLYTQFSLQYTRGVHGKIPGGTVSICVHPWSAHKKNLILNTASSD